MYLKKKFFWKVIKISFTQRLFFKVDLKHNCKKKIEKKSETTFSKQFCPNIFYVFCARLQNGTQKTYWKPNSSVILSTSWILQIFVNFWAFLLLCGLVSNIFTMFFRDSEVCMEGYDSKGDFGYLTKNLKYYWKRNLLKNTLSFYCNPDSAPLRMYLWFFYLQHLNELWAWQTSISWPLVSADH